MASKSAIEWTEATWNPTYGCTKIARPCRFCYIDRTPPYRINGKKFVSGSIPIELMPERLTWPLRWREPRRIFVDSLSDLFHEDVPSEFIARVYATMKLAHWHTFQMLTKRPERRRQLLSSSSFGELVYDFAKEMAMGTAAPKPARQGLEAISAGRWPLRNVWEGVTVGDQRDANAFVPILLDTPADVRFLSCEPLLGPIDLTREYYDAADVEYMQTEEAHQNGYFPPRVPPAIKSLDWVIAGGESGPQIAGPRATVGGARRALVEPTDGTYKDARGAFSGNGAWRVKPEALAMVRSLRDQCVAAGVAFHFKQWGGPKSKSAGRELDGRTWDERPETWAEICEAEAQRAFAGDLEPLR